MGFWISKMASILSNFGGLDARVCMLGLDAAGKTTLLYKLKLNETISTIPTIGFNVETVTPVKGLTMTVWDIGGQEKLRPLWKHYYDQCSAIIFVVDSNDPSRFEEAKYELYSILDADQLRYVPLLVLANKQDLPQARAVSHIADAFGLHKLQTRRWHVRSTCATTGDGLFEGMEILAEMVRQFKKSSRY